MKITTAWTDDGDGLPWLIAAYDEVTENVHNGEPEFFTAVVASTKADGYEVRLMVLDVPDEAIESLFSVPVVPAASGGS